LVVLLVGWLGLLGNWLLGCRRNAVAAIAVNNVKRRRRVLCQ